MTSADVDYAGLVREYLAYCADARGQVEARGFRVDPRHHPSAEGAVKMIPHGSDRARAEAIRRTFGELMSEVTGPVAGTLQPQAEVLRAAEAGL